MATKEKLQNTTQDGVRVTPDGLYRVERRKSSHDGYVTYHVRYTGQEHASTSLAVIDLESEIRPAITAHRQSGRRTWWPHLVTQTANR
jgi:hypothetical protein